MMDLICQDQLVLSENFSFAKEYIDYSSAPASCIFHYTGFVRADLFLRLGELAPKNST